MKHFAVILAATTLAASPALAQTGASVPGAPKSRSTSPGSPATTQAAKNKRPGAKSAGGPVLRQAAHSPRKDKRKHR